MSRILVAGCGYVGTRLARRLATGGHRVFGLRLVAGGYTFRYPTFRDGYAPLVDALAGDASAGFAQGGRP